MGNGDPSAMSDVELLATLIRCPATADRLMRRFDGLRTLLQADVALLRSVRGMGIARAAVIRSLPELARRYFDESLPAGAAIRSPADTEAFLNARLRHLGHELFCCLFLDNRHRVLAFEEMFRGTIDGTSVYPREVVKEALSINAAAVILAHNH